jgi:hypothetical protein
MCKSRGMHVAQLESKEESDSVSKFLNDAGLSATPFFTTQRVELIPGKPDSKLQEGCSSIFNSLLRSQSCTEEINFMCENSKKPFELLPFDKGYYYNC